MADFHNPQQEPGMERKLLLVFALTFLVIMLFQPLLKRYMPQPPAATPQSSQSAPTAGGPAVPAPTTSNAVAAPEPTPSAKTKQPAIAPKQASSESETVIENDRYRIVFTNRGGQVKSWVLKQYTDDKDKPLDLVNTAAAQKYGYPLSLWTYDEALRNKLNSALYVASSTGSSAPAEVTFEYADGDTVVHKSFKFDHSYVVEARTSVQVKGAEVSAFPMWPSGFGDETRGASYALSQIAYQYGSSIQRLEMKGSFFGSSKKIAGGDTLAGPFQWAGVTDQYFTAAFIPKDPATAALVTLRYPVEIPHDPKDPNNKQMDKAEVLGAAVGNLKGPTETRLYVGPKALTELESVSVPGITGAEPDLRAVVDFGSWLGYIARPLFLWLKWTYAQVHNWGWAIVLQTIVINLALLPLRLSQMKSMLKMQRIQPQIKAIQEKYKKYSIRDPEKAKMNEEVAALYKKEGVNPVGGCLPLIIQMPFLFAYYRMLNVAMDLRHANWLWIHDLSVPDPHYVLPIAVIVSMLIMQRMTPQAGMDPAQQKMMNVMMPVMMGVITLNLASGLCLYWSVGNVISIVQQSVMNRTSLGREMREMMAKRARKKDK